MRGKSSELAIGYGIRSERACHTADNENDITYQSISGPQKVVAQYLGSDPDCYIRLSPTWALARIGMGS